MSDQSTETLIDNLTEELSPMRRLVHPSLRALPWVALAMAYVAGVVNYLGLRPDLFAQFENSTFLFETGLMFFITLTAVLASAFLCVPDMRGRKWLVSVPSTLFLAFLLWTITRSFTEGIHMPAIHWDHCFQDRALMGFVPAVAIMFLGTRGATTRPRMMALMNILAVGALGYIGLRFTCSLDTVGHAALYHLFPFIVFGSALGFAARRIYRW